MTPSPHQFLSCQFLSCQQRQADPFSSGNWSAFGGATRDEQLREGDNDYDCRRRGLAGNWQLFLKETTQ
jgi:hypothetical protein